MGRWLPHFGFSSAFWDRATHTGKRDGFVYGKARSADGGYVGFQGLEEGTAFTYGLAGPPRGFAMYDGARHIAFFSEGCCSSNDVVAAADVAPPPKRLVSRDFRNLVTVRGVRLGQTEAEVMRTHGTATLQRVPGHDGVGVLSYTTWPPAASVGTHSACGQFQNFYFRKGRLVLIQLGNGC